VQPATCCTHMDARFKALMQIRVAKPTPTSSTSVLVVQVAVVVHKLSHLAQITATLDELSRARHIAKDAAHSVGVASQRVADQLLKLLQHQAEAFAAGPSEAMLQAISSTLQPFCQDSFDALASMHAKRLAQQAGGAAAAAQQAAREAGIAAAAAARSADTALLVLSAVQKTQQHQQHQQHQQVGHAQQLCRPGLDNSAAAQPLQHAASQPPVPHKRAVQHKQLQQHQQQQQEHAGPGTSKYVIAAAGSSGAAALEPAAKRPKSRGQQARRRPTYSELITASTLSSELVALLLEACRLDPKLAAGKCLRRHLDAAWPRVLQLPAPRDAHACMNSMAALQTRQDSGRSHCCPQSSECKYYARLAWSTAGT
jgi:hypothetical protein